MKTVKKIMVPLAFSPYSKGIIDYAVMLAKGLDAKQLIFANVINQRDVDAVETITSYGYNVDGEHYIEELKKERTASLEKMFDDVDFPREKVKVVITVGKPADELLKQAVKEKVDMIVMGVKGQSDIVHAFTGSVAEKLFRRSPVTIVSYREESIAAKLRKRITSKL